METRLKLVLNTTLDIFMLKETWPLKSHSFNCVMAFRWQPKFCNFVMSRHATRLLEFREQRGDETLAVYPVVTFYRSAVFLGYLYPQRGELPGWNNALPRRIAVLRELGLFDPEGCNKKDPAFCVFKGQNLGFRYHFQAHGCSTP